jgi:hypothetical protein
MIDSFHSSGNSSLFQIEIISLWIAPADRIVTRKEAEWKLKYNSLYTGIQRMWNLKCMIIPVIISHWNSNKRFKEKFGSHFRKMLSEFTTKDGCTGNITYNTENFIV